MCTLLNILRIKRYDIPKLSVSNYHLSQHHFCFFSQGGCFWRVWLYKVCEMTSRWIIFLWLYIISVFSKDYYIQQIYMCSLHIYHPSYSITGCLYWGNWNVNLLAESYNLNAMEYQNVNVVLVGQKWSQSIARFQLAPFSTKFAYLSMLFILQLAGQHKNK